MSATYENLQGRYYQLIYFITEGMEGSSVKYNHLPKVSDGVRKKTWDF